MILEIAIQNLSRNKRRVGLTLFSIVLATTFVVIFASIVNGVEFSFIAPAIDIDVGHVKIIPAQQGFAGFVPRTVISKENASLIEQKLGLFTSEYNIKGITQRIRLPAISNSSQYQKDIILIGIQPEREKDVSTLIKLADSLDLKNGFVGLGLDVAKSLNVDIGQNLTLQVSQEFFSVKIKYIFQTNWKEIDQKAIYIDLTFLESKLNLSGVSEIVVRLENYLLAQSLADALYEELKDYPQLQIKTWEEELSSILNMVNMARGFMLLFYGLFLLAIVASIMLTTYMAVNERTREIGTLGSLGMKPWEIIAIFLLEAAFIGIIGSFLGTLLGILVTYPLTITGLDLSGSARTTAFVAVIYAVLDIGEIIFLGLFISCLSIPGALLPALKAARIDPVEALRKT
ncbi:MAG: ABC transporter permease [Candidatus Hermodarchaeota archaeon]